MTSPARRPTGSGSATSSTSRPARASSSSRSSRTCSAGGIIGWSMRDDLQGRARPRRARDGRHHPRREGRRRGGASDHGSQYTSVYRLRQALRDSTSRWERSATPATTPSARASSRHLENELLRRQRCASRDQARLAVFCYIECFYNPRRRHSSARHAQPDRLRTTTPAGGHRGLTLRCQRKRVTSSRSSPHARANDHGSPPNPPGSATGRSSQPQASCRASAPRPSPPPPARSPKSPCRPPLRSPRSWPATPSTSGRGGPSDTQ